MQGVNDSARGFESAMALAAHEARRVRLPVLVLSIFFVALASLIVAFHEPAPPRLVLPQARVVTVSFVGGLGGPPASVSLRAAPANASMADAVEVGVPMLERTSAPARAAAPRAPRAVESPSAPMSSFTAESESGDAPAVVQGHAEVSVPPPPAAPPVPPGPPAPPVWAGNAAAGHGSAASGKASAGGSGAHPAPPALRANAPGSKGSGGGAAARAGGRGVGASKKGLTAEELERLRRQREEAARRAAAAAAAASGQTTIIVGRERSLQEINAAPAE